MSLTSYRGYRVVQDDAGRFLVYDLSDRFVGRFSSHVQAVNAVDLFLEGGK